MNACHIKKARVLSKLRGDINKRSMMLRPFCAQRIEKKKACFLNYICTQIGRSQ